MSLYDLPIKRKLAGFIFLTSFVVLVVSFLVLLSYETRSFKQRTTRTMDTIAGIIAANSTAALMYDDAKLAREILAGVRAEEEIVEAALFNKQGKLYATYPAGMARAEFPQAPGPDGTTFGLTQLTLFKPAIQGDTRVGTLYLKSDLSGTYRRLRVYGLVLLAVLAGSTALAFFLSNFFQQQISQPILDLANTARAVSERKDYSVRATKMSGDELGFLTEAFNSMLEQIQRNHVAIAESEERFRVVADSAPVLIWLATPDRVRTWFNRNWLKFVGRPLAQEIGAGWKDNLFPDDAERYMEAYVGAFASRQEFRIEYRLRRHDGKYRWLLSHGVPRYQGSQFAGFIGSCVDISEHKEAEALVRSSELQLRLVTDHASVYLCHLDRSHRFKFANLAYAARYGRKPEEVIGRHISEIIGAEPYALALPWIEAAFTGKRQEFELELPYSDLGKRWVHLVYVPERSLEGEVVGLVAVLTDTTERRMAERELKRARDEALAASRAKDDFLAALSHELRTPLSPVLLLASDAAENPDLPPEIRADFETIRKNVELEARLIDDLLDLTRITRGKLILELQVVDAQTIVRDALATVRADLDAKRIKLVMEMGEAPPKVWGDPVRLQQVFWNVLKNAVKFTPDEGTITVRAGALSDQGMLVIRVTDTGIGMTAPELERVFEAFSQGDHAGSGGSHRFGGLGLGLAISRKVIELHSGKISVVSEGRHQGCTFTIELPLAGRREERAAEPPRRAPAVEIPVRPAAPFASAPGDRGAILLVEDHVPTRAALEHLLRRRSYRVVTAGTVAEARAAAESHKFDFVISDIGLPDGSGYDLMTELRKHYDLRGVALSGYGMEGDIARSHEAGFIVHLIKPVRVQLLDEALEAIAPGYQTVRSQK
ncbi:MAG TPA: ATP-binding protein [Opitutaceae bacterium]|nr:ATP-binding protein [Opitutaceae bacterium]